MTMLNHSGKSEPEPESSELAMDSMESYCGRWVPDLKRSESLDKMLKVMGVNFVIRKVALSLKEEINVSVDAKEASSDDQDGGVHMTIVNRTNISETSDTHLVNGREREIVTKKDVIRTSCTFDPEREFPLCIVAEIAKGKTVDQRKVDEEADEMVQRLSFTPAGSSDTVTSTRIWKHVSKAKPSEAFQSMLKKSSSAETEMESDDQIALLKRSSSAEVLSFCGRIMSCIMMTKEQWFSKPTLTVLSIVVGAYLYEIVTFWWTLSVVIVYSGSNVYLFGKTGQRPRFGSATDLDPLTDASRTRIRDRIAEGNTATWKFGNSPKDAPRLPTANIKATITSLRISRSETSSKSFAEYEIKVELGNGALKTSWSVWRRYSQFDALLTALRNSSQRISLLPALPPKRYLYSSLNGEFLEKRQEGLATFLSALITKEHRSSKAILTKPEVHFFLGYVPPSPLNGEDGPTLKDADRPQLSSQVLQSMKKAFALIKRAAAVGEGDGWELKGSQQGVQIYLKKEGSFVYSKGVGIVQASVSDMLSLLGDVDRKHLYDKLWKEERVLANWSDSEAVLKKVHEFIGASENETVTDASIKHAQFKSPFPLAIAPRNLVSSTVLVRSTVQGREKIVIALRSIPPHGNGCNPPCSSGSVRANLIAGGIVLQSVSGGSGQPDSCMVTSITMLDPNGSIPAWIVNKVAPSRCLGIARMNAALNS